MPTTGVPSFKRHLQTSVSASAAPYGYTLVIFSTGSVGDYMIGTPHVFEVLLYLAGAVLGFLLVEIAAFGHLRVRLREQSTAPVEAWGYAHLLSAGIAVVTCWGILQVIGTIVGWVVIGFLATAIYLSLNAVQTLIAERRAC